MTLAIMSVVFGLAWIGTLVACGVSVRWTFMQAPGRQMASGVLSGVSILVGLVGLARFSFVASSTTNGVVQWRFDSSWLFWTSVLGGFLSLVYAMFHRGITSLRA